MNELEYNAYIKQVTPTHNSPLNVLRVFLVGGIICTIAGPVILYGTVSSWALEIAYLLLGQLGWPV